MNSVTNLAYYQFRKLSNLPEFKDLTSLRMQLKEFCQAHQILGTILLAPEGINLVMAGSASSILALRGLLIDAWGFDPVQWKLSVSGDNPHRRLLVKIKKEIIAFGIPTVRPYETAAPRISPKQLKEWLDQNKNLVLLDTRNEYEVKAGTFEKARELDLDAFRDFPKQTKKLESELQISRDVPIVTFCTGGIRCEKAATYMLTQGYREVYQLDGGILRYFEEVGGAHFKGNCFVFDWREAVTPTLEPTPRSHEPRETFGRHRK